MSESPKLLRATVVETNEYFLQALRRNPKQQKLFILIFVAPAVILAMTLLDVLRGRIKNDRFWWIPLGAAVILCGWIYWWNSPRGQEVRLKKTLKKIVTVPPIEAHFEFSEAGFLSTGREGRSSFHPWTTVPEVHVFPDGISPIIDADSNLYFWIPRAAFTSDQAYEDVMAFVSIKVKKIQHHKA